MDEPEPIKIRHATHKAYHETNGTYRVDIQSELDANDPRDLVAMQEFEADIQELQEDNPLLKISFNHRVNFIPPKDKPEKPDEKAPEPIEDVIARVTKDY